MGREMGGGFGREGTRVYLWLILDVWQKTTKFCKAIILQLKNISVQFSSVQFSHSVVSDSATPWIAARQASLSITNSRSLLKLMSIELVIPSSHLSSVVPFSSCPQSLPASGSFPMSQLFTWGGQSVGVIDGETMETVADFIFLSSKITADGDCSHEIKRLLLRRRKAMTNLDSILKKQTSLCRQSSVYPMLWFF